jgi:hypothetical protein
MGISVNTLAAILAAVPGDPSPVAGHTVTFGFNDVLTDEEDIVGVLDCSNTATYEAGVSGNALVGDTVGIYDSVLTRQGGGLSPGVFGVQGTAFFIKMSEGTLRNTYIISSSVIIQLSSGSCGVYLVTPGLVTAHTFSQSIGEWAHFAIDVGSATHPIKVWRNGSLVYTAPSNGRLYGTDVPDFQFVLQLSINRSVDSLVFTDVPLTDDIVAYLLATPV